MNEEARISALDVKVTALEKRVDRLDSLTSNYKGEVQKLNSLNQDIEEIKSNVQKLIDIKDQEMKEKLEEHNKIINSAIEKVILFLLGGGITYFIQSFINKG